MKANYQHQLLLVILLATTCISTAQANEEVIDSEFLEFLADMEEVTGPGFDRWIEDDSVDTNIEINQQELDQNMQSNKK